MFNGEAASPGSGAPEFQKVLRGWDPDEVREYLDVVSSRVRDLETRIRTLEAELEEARSERDKAQAVDSDPYASVSGHVADLLRDLDDHVASVRAAADMEAARIRSEVQTLRTSITDDLRAIRDRMANSLKELDAALALDATPAATDVVTLPDVQDEAPAGTGGPTDRNVTGSAAMLEGAAGQGALERPTGGP